ncbi:MAG: YggS family pyridoxal phosphate-dependent enzyme [Erysipelotrichaceae bacterium]
MQVNKNAVLSILEKVKPAKLVAATKYVGIDEINELEKLGVTIFGENRVQSLLEKYEKYHGNGSFHMIGTLQPNKVKYIIDKVSLIHSVNAYSLIKEIEKQAKKHDLIMPVLLQVNIAKEATKHGFMEEELYDVLCFMKNCPRVQVHGLMMMAPNKDVQKIQGYFKQTADLLATLQRKFPQYPLTELSMGMSNDYEAAIENGSTMVRIGSALFK